MSLEASLTADGTQSQHNFWPFHRIGSLYFRRKNQNRCNDWSLSFFILQLPLTGLQTEGKLPEGSPICLLAWELMLVGCSHCFYQKGQQTNALSPTFSFKILF